MADTDQDFIKSIIDSSITLPEEESRLEGKRWRISHELETFDKAFRFSRQITTKETSLERIERKIDSLMRDVATRDDLIAQTCFLQVKKCPIYYRKSAHFEKRKIKIII